jgi:hypothetical protein
MKVTVCRILNPCSGCSSSLETLNLDFEVEPRIGDRLELWDEHDGRWIHATVTERRHTPTEGDIELPMELVVLAKTDEEIRQDKVREWLGL